MIAQAEKSVGGFVRTFESYVNDDGITLWKHTRNGFYDEDGGYRYYVDGVAKTGWITVDGNKYYVYLGTKLLVSTATVTIAKVEYNFESVKVGNYTLWKLIEGEAKNGFVAEQGGIRYYVNNKYVTGWKSITVNGTAYDFYFLSSNGLMVTADRLVGGVMRYVTPVEADGITVYAITNK